jgi:uncharacterized membrane protein
MPAKFLIKEIFIVLVTLIPAFYLAYVYPSLPETVPIHFDLYGKPNGYGHKNILIFTTAFLIAVTFGLYFLIKFLPKIDPKKSAKISSGAFQKIAIALVIFLAALNVIIIYSSVSGRFNFSRVFNPLMGFIYIYILAI